MELEMCCEYSKGNLLKMSLVAVIEKIDISSIYWFLLTCVLCFSCFVVVIVTRARARVCGVDMFYKAAALAGWLACWLTDLLTDWLAGWMTCNWLFEMEPCTTLTPKSNHITS